jgi:hypothetical protein
METQAEWSGGEPSRVSRHGARSDPGAACLASAGRAGRGCVALLTMAGGGWSD